MRGIGGFGGGFLGLGMAGALAGALSLASDGLYPGDRRHYGRRSTRATGWQDKPFQHPEGASSFRPTGSKRSRRRAAKRAK